MLTIDEIYDKIDKLGSLNKKISYTHKNKTKNKSIRLSIGRVWFNTLLPDNFPLIDEPVNKSTLNNIIKQIHQKYKSEQAVKIISNLQREAFKLATLFPNSFQIDALIIPDDLKEKKKKFEEKAKNLSPEEFQKESDKLAKEFVNYIRKQDLPLQAVLDGGIKGDPIDKWKTLLIAKGYVADVEGNILGPITKGISEGLTPKEYYMSAAEARRGFYYKSTAVQKPGYLARKIITANANLKYDKKDCRSKKYFELKVDSKFANLLVGRFMNNNGKIVEIKDPKQISGKRIKLRSPLYCKSKKGICKICYGRLAEELKSENIGIIAGGAINEFVVMHMMKMRHKSSQVEVIKVNFVDSIKKSSLNTKLMNYYFDIQPTKISAKHPCKVILNKDDYDEKSLITSTDYYILPGLFNVYFGEGKDEEVITLPFNFKVNLIKPESIFLEGKTITCEYGVGDLILEKDQYIKDEDPAVVEKLFEGGMKFITNPETLLLMIHEELPKIDLIHIECVVSNMFRDANDLTKPCRLTNYKNFQIVGQKNLPFVTSWLNALAFENINKAIKTGLVSGTEAEMNPLEKLIFRDIHAKI